MKGTYVASPRTTKFRDAEKIGKGDRQVAGSMNRSIVTAVVVVLGCAALGIGISLCWHRGEATVAREPDALADAAPKAETPRAAASRSTPESKRQERSDTSVKQMKRRLPAAQAQGYAEAAAPASVAAIGTAGSNAPPATAGIATNETEATVKNLLGSISTMMKYPATKAMIQANMKSEQEMGLAPLLKFLKLSEQDTATFKDLALQKEMVGMNLGVDFMGGEMSLEQAKEITEKVGGVTRKLDEKINELLGEEKYAVYTEYMATQPERREVSELKAALPADEALTAQQEHDLIRAMYEEHKKTSDPLAPEGYGTPGAGAKIPMFFSDDQMDKLLSNYVVVASNVSQRAAAILSPEQLMRFQALQDRQLMKMQSAMKMTAQMIGGNAKKESSKTAP